MKLTKIPLTLEGYWERNIVRGMKRSISIRMAVSTLVVIHLVVAYWHGNAHEKLSVGLSSAQRLFVNGVIVLLPLVATLIIWTPRQRTALGLFLASMLSSLIFGVYHHFIAVSSDNIAYLPPGTAGWHWQFVASSAALASLEIVAVLYGVYVLSCLREQMTAADESARAVSMTPQIRILHNPHCQRCARIGRFHKRFDWLHRIEITIAEPATGPLVPGEVVVEELATGRYLAGFPAFAAICRAIPLYCPVRALFLIPAFRRYVAREISAGKITEA